MVQASYGITGDFVFSTAKGASNKRQISDYMYNKKVQYKIDQPVSIHAQRRTLNSKMENAGVSNSVRASLLGHSENTNNRFYTYDRTTMDFKKDALAKAIAM